MTDPSLIIKAHDNEVARQVLTDAAAFLKAIDHRAAADHVEEMRWQYPPLESLEAWAAEHQNEDRP